MLSGMSQPIPDPVNIDFADKLNQITRDPARAREMGLAGRQRCIDEFSWEKIAQETVEVYKAAIAHHQAKKG